MSGAERFTEFEERFKRERELAAPQIDAIRHDPPSEPAPDWITLGFAYELCGAAHEAATPDESDALARLAIAIAERLGDAYRPVVRRQVTVRAWKELALAHCTRGRHADALAALDRAGDVIDDDPALASEEAVLTLCRSITLSHLNRQEDALQLLAEARSVFEQLGDGPHLVQCELQSGLLSQRRGDAAAAERSYREASRLALAAGDARTAGSAALDLGVLCARGGRVDEAMQSLAQAQAIFRELDARDELARGDLGIGDALLAAGKAEAAIPLLSGARDAFRLLGMAEESGLAGVEIVEALLALDRTAPARTLLEEVIDEFRRNHLNERALVALTYLRGLPVPRHATATHVRSYLSRLRREPQLLFVVPNED